LHEAVLGNSGSRHDTLMIVLGRCLLLWLLLLLLLLSRAMELLLLLLLLLLPRALDLQGLVWVMLLLLLMLARHLMSGVDLMTLPCDLLLHIRLLLGLWLRMLLSKLDMDYRARAGHLMILWGRRIVVLCSLLMIHRLLLVALEMLLLLLRLWLLHLMRSRHGSCMVLLRWRLRRRRLGST